MGEMRSVPVKAHNKWTKVVRDGAYGDEGSGWRRRRQEARGR